MGSTMHAHIEVKKNNQWLHYAAPSVTRDALGFAVIAGIRKETVEEMLHTSITPVGKIHKMPDDSSEITEISYEQDRGYYYLHDLMVLTADDLIAIQEQMDNINQEIGRIRIDLEDDILHTYIANNSIARHEGYDDVRVILWFDN